MSTPTLHICRWSDTFENADTRKRERLKFFYAPSGCDSRGYLTLVSRFPQVQAMMAFGVFQALCQISGTLAKNIRGSFRNTDGTPMELQQIACLLRLDAAIVSAALEILTDERLKWCEWQGGKPPAPQAIAPPVVKIEAPASVKPTPLREEPTLALMPPADDWGDAMPTEAARDYAALQKRINSLHPAWLKRPHLSRIEQEELMANAKIFFDLMESDWDLLKCYMAAKINPDWDIKPKPWQPDQRGMLVKNVTDILNHADRWARECKKRKVPTGMKGGEA